MNDIEKSVLAKVTNVLSALKLEFAIIDSDGNKHGNLNLAPVKTKRVAASPYPRGQLRAYIKPYLDNMMINTSKVIPANGLQIKFLAAAASNYAKDTWGNGSYRCVRSADGKSITFTRLDPSVTSFMQQDPLADLLKDWN